MGDTAKRLDVLIGELRGIARSEVATEHLVAEDITVITTAADELEARMGGMHIDAKHWAEVGRLRAEVRRLNEQSQSVTPRDMSMLATGWDVAVASMRYDDGSSVEIAENVNPYRTNGEQA